MQKRIYIALIFLSVLGAVLFIPSPAAQPLSSEPVEPRTAFVHLFEWRWDDIAQECETFLGPKGYAAVQISPPNEHLVLAERNFPWWQRYQPVSYRLESRSGDRTQLIRMIRRCHAAGVKIYADAVINHMAGVAQGQGSAGSRFTKYEYPGLYTSQDFNDCRRNIQNYQDRYDVTSCELVGLSDLRTDSPRVRQRLVQYLQSLVNLGIDGFRIDAAKHIPAADLGAILALLNHSVPRQPFIYQEVIDPGTEAIKKLEYYPNGDVLEFEYGRMVSESMMGLDGKNLAQLKTLGETWGLAPSAKSIPFIDNHDKQRGHAGGGNYLTYQDGRLYELANVFLLAHPYGYPQVMSSYAFSDSDQGPPADARGQTHPVYVDGNNRCGQQWVCEHRWTAIANMVAFRNTTASVPQVTDWWSNGNNQIAFGRGDRGFVVINRENTPLVQIFQTQLPAGTYCNVIRGERTSDQSSCSSTAITVAANGEIAVTVPPMEAIAIHGGAKIKATAPS